VWQTGTNRKKWHISKIPENKEGANLFLVSKRDGKDHEDPYIPTQDELASDIPEALKDKPQEFHLEESTNPEDVW
jgi:hypothetical protein